MPTTLPEVIPALIRKWGKVLAYVNEQVQEHLAKVVTQLLHLATKHSKSLEPYPRAVAVSSQARRRQDHHGHASPAHKHILERVTDWHWPMYQAMTDNRTALRMMRGFGEAVWKQKEGRRLLRSISRCS
jgi:hypothetical protein